MTFRILCLATLIFLSGCAALTGTPLEFSSGLVSDSTQKASVTLTDLGLAPELAGKTWLNTDGPLASADLDGKVLLIEFWTFG